MARRQVHLIGVPLDLGGARRGVDMGPSAIRLTGLADRLSALGADVTDRGNVATPTPETRVAHDPTKRYIREIARVCERLYRLARQSHALGALPVVLGGDHSLAAGSVAASADAAGGSGAESDTGIGLIWLDAHGDMNTPATTTSGNVHGMALAALIGAEPAELATVGRRTPAVAASRAVLVGVRNLDTLERDRIRDSRVQVFTMKDIDRLGIASVMEQAIAIATNGTAGIHVSCDLDVCDPTIAPGVGTPVNGGLNYREAHLAMEMIADSGRLVALDLVEINPVLDTRNQTAQLGAELALSALGMRII